ncbi:response regulator [Pasteurellaceae bacterium LIM206]|nr:response regulator [Pasteurellaceae bacterium LIM206]
MPKILLVDDDIELTELLSELLTLDGFEIDIAHNGQEALNKLNQTYDLILLDVMMPVLNGIETLKEIRKISNQPVLMLTARGSELDRVLGLELGADDYLSKPFNDRELVARIKAILRRITTVPATAETTEKTSSAANDDKKTIEFYGITLYPGRQQAIYQNKDLELTGTEYALLQILVTHPGDVLSRELLSAEALGKRLSPFDRAIDMHMSNLRKKLPPRRNNLPWFKTLRGRGYIILTE